MSPPILKRSTDRFGHKLRWAFVLIIFAIAVGLFFGTLLYRISDNENSKIRSGRTALSNCQQIELIKAQIRRTLEATHSTDKAVGRFLPRDCYGLPVVQAAGIKPPKHKGE